MWICKTSDRHKGMPEAAVGGCVPPVPVAPVGKDGVGAAGQLRAGVTDLFGCLQHTLVLPPGWKDTYDF